jgi:Protein of unknown function (DUF2933)
MAHLLPYLLFLVCPISMGAMMLVMMRGNKETPNREVDLEKRVRELEHELRHDSKPEDAVQLSAHR